MEKKTIIKWILGSIGVSLILSVVILTNLPSSMLGFVVYGILILFGIEKARQHLTKKYHISFGRFLLLTMLPAVLAYGVYVCFYVYMENNYWAELEGLLGYIILLAWGGCIGVSAGGTLLIAFARWLGTRHMLPPILAYGVYVCFYVYMENNYWAELEGLLGYIILLVWGGCTGVLVGGTLLIAFVNWLKTRRKKEKDVE
ncbi:MAG: hypothetical protein IKK33_18245 [Lachnospiraceae bacterium]|nr:hypothetical protein [Lachnospiraceae bacterium]